MLTIRFARIGKKNKAQFKIMLQEKSFAPGGRHVEILGSYNPHAKNAVLKEERIKYWISKGAQMSDTVYNLLVSKNIVSSKKRPINFSTKKSEEDSTEDSDKKENKTQEKPAEKPSSPAPVKDQSEVSQEKEKNKEEKTKKESEKKEEGEKQKDDKSEKKEEEETKEETKEEKVKKEKTE